MIASKTPPSFNTSKDIEKNTQSVVKEKTLYWDERDRYSDEQNALLSRLGAQKFGKSICITELNTVILKNLYTEEEILFDDFIKKQSSLIAKGESAIKYDKETNKFYKVEKEKYGYNPLVYCNELDINEEVMKDYAFGKYNVITSKLHDLHLKSMSNEEKQMIEKKKKQEITEIIEKTNIKHELITPAEARIYLDYLEELKNTNTNVIKKNTGKIVAATSIPIVATTAVSAIVGAYDSTLFDLLFSSGATLFLSTTLVDFFLVIEEKADPILPLSGFGIWDYIQEPIEAIKNKIKENKVIKGKAKMLNQIENVDKMVIANSYSVEEFDKTLDNEKLKSLNLKNSIMNSLDGIVNRANLLNADARKKVLIEAQKILNDYTERYTNIINQDTNVIDLEADNYMKLKIQILTRIADLELEVVEERQKDVAIKKVTDESRLLSDKIDGLNEFNNIDFDIEKIHKQNAKKVHVKTLKEKKKEVI